MSLFRSRQEVLPEKAKYEFLYPTSTQFPFDEVCGQIVHELQKRNYDVPGIKVELGYSGAGNRKFCYVSKITSDDFKIWFCRTQGKPKDSNENDIAAPTEIHIPKKELHVHNDESGPVYYIYVGQDWEKDREEFMHNIKVHSKMNRWPRTYLCYKGGSRCVNGRPMKLVPDNDCGREYDPNENEPREFSVSVVFDTFTKYLTNVVLKRILEAPIHKELIDILRLPKVIPMPTLNYRILYLGDSKDFTRITMCQNGKGDLKPYCHFGLSGSGVRLLSLGVKVEDDIPEVVFDGFGYCSLSPLDKMDVDILFSRFMNYQSDARDAHALIEIKPNRANGIYVIDNAALLKRRNELEGKIKAENRTQFTDSEVGDFQTARAKTIVPITEYKGNYEQPVIIFNREIDLDEVQIVKLLKL